MTPNIRALVAATRERREKAEHAVRRALGKARQLNAPVTFAGIGAAAGVSPDFIYRHPELRPEVEALRRARSASPAPPENGDAEAAESTLIRRLTLQLADTRRKHREDVSELRRALEAAQGELLALRRQLKA